MSNIERNRKIVDLLVEGNLSQAKIGELFNISSSMVGVIKKQNLEEITQRRNSNAVGQQPAERTVNSQQVEEIQTVERNVVVHKDGTTSQFKTLATNMAQLYNEIKTRFNISELSAYIPKYRSKLEATSTKNLPNDIHIVIIITTTKVKAGG